MIRREGDKQYRVFIVHNFFNGHCYDYSGVSYFTYGQDEGDALARARMHKEDIENDLRARRYHGKNLLIRKSDNYRLKDHDIHSPKLVLEY